MDNTENRNLADINANIRELRAERRAYIINTISKKIQTVAKTAITMGANQLSSMKNKISQVRQNVVSRVSDIAQQIKATAVAGAFKIKDASTRLKNNIVHKITVAKNFIGMAVTNTKDKFKANVSNLFKAVKNKFVSNAERAKTVATNLKNNVVHKVKSSASTMATAAKNKANKLKQEIGLYLPNIGLSLRLAALSVGNKALFKFTELVEAKEKAKKSVGNFFDNLKENMFSQPMKIKDSTKRVKDKNTKNADTTKSTIGDFLREKYNQFKTTAKAFSPNVGLHLQIAGLKVGNMVLKSGLKIKDAATRVKDNVVQKTTTTIAFLKNSVVAAKDRFKTTTTNFYNRTKNGIVDKVTHVAAKATKLKNNVHHKVKTRINLIGISIKARKEQFKTANAERRAMLVDKVNREREIRQQLKDQIKGKIPQITPEVATAAPAYAR